jgi:DNA mismatch repair protein MutS
MSSFDRSNQLTPMLRQYEEIKRQYPGTLLFFRLGDFYELFFDDALIGARELEITLTARQKERGAPIPMCGVPYHAATGHIAKLVRKGYRVAICEQTEDPASTTKLVRREVIRVVTPGTALESQLLDSKQNAYLAAVCGAGEGMGLSILDLSTGEFLATEFRGESAWNLLYEQLAIFAPREIIFPRSLTPLFKKLSPNSGLTLSDPGPSRGGEEGMGGATLTDLDDWVFSYEMAEKDLLRQLGVLTLDGFGLAGHNYAVAAAGAAVHYVNETQRTQAQHFKSISFFSTRDSLVLDATTIDNLELISSIDGKTAPSLVGVIDQTLTGMGARLLRNWLLRPSILLDEINARLDAVEEMLRSTIKRDRLRRLLESIVDLERLTGKLSLNRATARDLLALRQTLDSLPKIKSELASTSALLLRELDDRLDELPAVKELIAKSIADDPPAAANEPGMIRDGYDADLDELRRLARSGKTDIASIEARERSRTGISTLKIKFNNVFGYFIEISHAHRERIPSDYERKQTLVNAERYTTPELKEFETKVLGAEERIQTIEVSLFNDIRTQVAQEVARLIGNARAIATIDVLLSLAEIAARRHYTRPLIHDGDHLEIKAGRHPIIETRSERFIPNDLQMNNSTDRLLIITGPNMGGKSVYLKQAALIVILAHLGSFVPAESARIPLTDRIFTRVGASDNLARGRSTFMVEMIETANILNTATPRSLILFDEVGRGTSTFDGLSIAWAIAEYVHDDASHAAKTLFATHYHEMTELAKLRPGVRNYQVAVSEANGEIVFLRRVVPGSANKSYGIEVARLAGLPRPVIERAREILINLEQNELDLTGKPKFARHLKKPSKLLNQPSLLEIFEPDQDVGAADDANDDERAE